jgi:transcriptional regulator with XRE-family HTH domain
MGTKTGRQTTDAVEILHRRYVDGNPKAAAMLEEVRAEAEVARSIYRIRTDAGLTQQDLATRIGTTASVISRLEDADYSGHSLAMLRRIAAALGRRVEIRFPTVRDGAAKGQKRPVTKVGEDSEVRIPKTKTFGRRSSSKTGKSSK